MATSRAQVEAAAGQITWTRDLARDLFPGIATPFAWTALRAPAEAALRRALVELGAPEPLAPRLWQQAGDGKVYVNATALAEASRDLYGAAWLGPVAGELPSGMVARIRAGSHIQTTQKRVAAAMTNVQRTHAELANWLAWVRGLRWAQADLLQVMEELEPQARNVLQTYFILRAGLAAAGTAVTGLLATWLPDRPPDVAWGLYAGLEGMPSAEAAYAMAVAARDNATRPEVLARHGHRGPGEMRADGCRWADNPRLTADLAAQRPLRNPDSARVQRRAAEAWVVGRLESASGRQFEPTLRQAQDLCRAVDVAWDALTMVMAAAQCWVQAVAAEAMTAKLILQPSDVLYLELEELKQVATTEWHRGRNEEVREEVARRRASMVSSLAAEGTMAGLRQVPLRWAEEGSTEPAGGPGQSHGPAYLASPAVEAPPPGAIWLGEAADPGSAPFWLGAGAIVTAAVDPWSPGLIVARSLGVPAVTGAARAVAQAEPGQTVVVDGYTGQIRLEA